MNDKILTFIDSLERHILKDEGVRPLWPLLSLYAENGEKLSPIAQSVVRNYVLKYYRTDILRCAVPAKILDEITGLEWHSGSADKAQQKGDALALCEALRR